MKKKKGESLYRGFNAIFSPFLYREKRRRERERKIYRSDDQLKKKRRESSSSSSPSSLCPSVRHKIVKGMIDPAPRSSRRSSIRAAPRGAPFQPAPNAERDERAGCRTFLVVSVAQADVPETTSLGYQRTHSQQQQTHPIAAMPSRPPQSRLE